MIAEEEDNSRRLAVGDTVVYAAHGIGRIVGREQGRAGGADRDCFVVDLATGLRVTLTVEDAAGRLRAVMGKRELETVRRTLASTPSARDEPWTKRIKESKAKLAAGRATDLAEIVRDGERLERVRGGPRLSQGESHVYRRARALLVGEVSSARGVDEDEAEAWIEEQIGLADPVAD
ncbi:MAG TPA: CarD family transcriptional regulator [Gaiellaceae bacterium]|nr:CarD family transcriptional regulator [Gaiellaceae bacterium]